MIPILILIAGLMILIERFWPGQSLPTVKGWWLRILLVNLAQLGIVLLAGVAWDRWLAGVSIWRLTDWLGTFGAAVVAYLISTLVYYGWHRVRHESDFFWRLCHQLHHSPQRIEILASFYKHPVEILINSWISALLVYGLLGLSLESASIYTGLTAVAEYFYHWNVRTPPSVGGLAGATPGVPPGASPISAPQSELCGPSRMGLAFWNAEQPAKITEAMWL